MTAARPSKKAPHRPTAAAALLLATAAFFIATGQSVAQAPPAQLELDEVSQYSHIRVERSGSVRTLIFVRDSGEEVVESRVDLRRKDDLLVPYTRYMFLSYLFRPRPKRVLIIGLGGGAMVHFLQAHDPDVKVDVVEVDTSIVSVADRFFDVRSAGNVDVKVADGLDYLRDSEEKYDVIYMDAFLRPSGGTDATGAPLHLKTLAFYDQIKKRLEPDGVVMYNLNPHRYVQQDVLNIRKAFPHAYVFQIENREGFVVAASTAAEPLKVGARRAGADRLDERFKAGFSFRAMADRLQGR